MRRRFDAIALRRIAIGFVAGIATLPALAPRAHAQTTAETPSLDQAKMLFNAGTQAYAKASYGDAIKAFSAAYRMAPRPTILFSLAQAERRQYFASDNDQAVLRDAIAHFRQYLAEVKEGGRRADAVAALGELESHVPSGNGAPNATTSGATTTPPQPQDTQLVVSTSAANAAIWLDGVRADSVPLIKSVAPGRHHIKTSADGYFDDERDVVAVKGVPYPVDVNLRERPALAMVQAPDGSDISIDGRFVGSTPLVRPLEVPPGTHVLAVTKNGYKAFTASLRLERNQRVNVPVRFDATSQRVASLTLLGAGAAVVVGGGVLTAVAFGEQAKAQRVLDQRSTQNIPSSDLQTYSDAVDARDRWKTAATIAFGGGAALLLTGGFLYFFDRPQVALPAPPAGETPEKPPAPKQDTEMMGALPMVGPGVYGASLFGRF